MYEAQEFEAETFPLCELIEKEDATDQHQDDQSSIHAEPLESFSLTDLYHICKLHLCLFGSESQDKALELQPPLKAYHVASYLVHCLRTLPGKIPFIIIFFCIHLCGCIGHNADYLLAGANIRMCHHRIKDLHSNVTVHSRLVLQSAQNIHLWNITLRHNMLLHKPCCIKCILLKSTRSA